MLSKTSLIFFSLSLSIAFCSVKAEINNNKPPLSLTLEQVKSWSQNQQIKDDSHVSHQAVKPRFRATTGIAADENLKVLIAPDGMNNLGNYNSEQDKFNLYNFTHWSNIDVLCWFAGTANETVSIPARPWVDAAHRNGVKVLGSIFLAVNQYGGSVETVKSFLERDEHGNFPVARQLVAIANFYNFDGWLMNQETDLTLLKDADGNVIKNKRDLKSGTFLAQEMQDFMRYLTSIAPEHMEIHWYDAMITDGQVRWQNMLNEKNAPYIQQGKERISDAVFLNYWWNKEMANESFQNVVALNRSPYDVYFGVDLWPERNAQRIFSSSDWLKALFPKENRQGLGSIALFGNNANFNFSGSKKAKALSTFQENKEDYRSFYQAEVRLFAGDDLNIATKDDGETWIGLGHFIEPKSTLTALPFETSFNTGHGLHKFKQGKVIGSEWHNVGVQDVQPTWQFAVFGNDSVKVEYDFKAAFDGGSSLVIAGNLNEGDASIPLYSTQFTVLDETKLNLIFKQNTKKAVLSVWLETSDGELIDVAMPSKGTGWESQTFSLSAHQGKSITKIGVRTRVAELPNYQANIGYMSLK